MVELQVDNEWCDRGRTGENIKICNIDVGIININVRFMLHIFIILYCALRNDREKPISFRRANSGVMNY